MDIQGVVVRFDVCVMSVFRVAFVCFRHNGRIVSSILFAVAAGRWTPCDVISFKMAAPMREWIVCIVKFYRLWRVIVCTSDLMLIRRVGVGTAGMQADERSPHYEFFEYCA